MKITSIEVIRLNNGKGPLEGQIWKPIVVKVNTNEGISGLGEIGFAYNEVNNAAFGILRDFGELIIGENPYNIEKIWEKFYRNTFWGYGGGAIIFGGMSAIDIALWDIKGKALGVPVYQLIGGKTNDKLRTYASQLQLDWGVDCRAMYDPKEYGEAACKAKEEGYTCIKVNPFMFVPNAGPFDKKYTGHMSRKNIKMASARIAAIREFAGADMDIMIEMHALTDSNTAVQVAHELEQYDIMYMEEAGGILNPDSLKEISNNTIIPQALGERNYSRFGFKPFFENRSVKLIQPDLGNTGGITEGKKIADMSYIYDIGVQAHVCGGPVATAAALQFEAAIPNFVIHELHASALMKENIDLCTNAYLPKDGYFEVPDKPGIGQELSEKALKAADIFEIR